MSEILLDESNTTRESTCNKKLKEDGDLKECNESNKPEEHVKVVAAHYNQIEEKGIDKRYDSPIFYLRNFNNWVKSVLILEFIDKLREKNYGRTIRVLDICCGKGGDLAKWKNSRVDRVVFADIAEVSVQQCRARYEDMQRRFGRLFNAEFIAVDCTKDTLRDKYEDPSIKFDIVSCQFGLHYSFESLTQARRMLSNISECLKPGGFFFGTIPDANEIVSRAKKSHGYMFGNRVYNIKLLFDPEKGFPLFGAKYDFHLEGVVDCPEFLVYFKLFVKLAEEYGLELVDKANFREFHHRYAEKHKQLLQKINCFETFPAPPGKKLIGEPDDYEHAQDAYDERKANNEHARVGTMCSSEWDVATIYMTFAFKKMKHECDSNGKPIYIRKEKKEPTDKKTI